MWQFFSSFLRVNHFPMQFLYSIIAPNFGQSLLNFEKSPSVTVSDC